MQKGDFVKINYVGRLETGEVFDLTDAEIAKKEGLFQKSDTDELLLVAKSILDQNKDVALSYKEGKTSAIQFLVGQGMKATKGSANPNLIRSIFEDLLKA